VAAQSMASRMVFICIELDSLPGGTEEYHGFKTEGGPGGIQTEHPWNVS
jgi:hypothetical protein